LTGQQLFDAFLYELETGAGDKSLMVMVAGPNGAGKTTLWRQILEPMLGSDMDIIYINADEIERELNPVAQGHAPGPQTEETAQQAQYEATRRRELLLNVLPNLQSHFVFETVFSDPFGYKLKELQQGVAAGYHVVLLFVGVDDVELAKLRVTHRVSVGGHDVPTLRQEERFPRVFENAHRALQIVHLAAFFDNSRESENGTFAHRPVAVIKNGSLLAQHDNMPAWWAMIDCADADN
jgi:predicted ABC-type ATPase